MTATTATNYGRRATDMTLEALADMWADAGDSATPLATLEAALYTGPLRRATDAQEAAAAA